MAVVSSFHSDDRETSQIRCQTYRRWIPHSPGRTPPRPNRPVARLHQSPRRRPQVPGGRDGDGHAVGQRVADSIGGGKFVAVDFGALMFSMERGQDIRYVLFVYSVSTNHNYIRHGINDSI
jgi:hypothetical protein